MICDYNDAQCRQRGYCDCRQQDNTPEAAAGCGGLMIWLLVGIVAAFIYPAMKILRSDIECEADGSPKFAGAIWLFLSPVFGFLSNVLYQVVFAVGACALAALQSRVTNSVYVAGALLIYFLSISLALLAFIFKNRMTLKNFLVRAETRTANRTLTVIGVGGMTLLTGFAGVGVVHSAARGYSLHRAEINAESERREKTIVADAAKFDSYVGKYKLITINDDTLFRVKKSGKHLRLSRDDRKASGILPRTAKEGCLLTPQLEGNSIFFAVSECVVDGKPSPLAKVYFEIRKSRTVMSFVYNVRASGDELEKIE